MAQNPAGPPTPRPNARPAPPAGGDDLDSLLDSIMGDDPGPPKERSADPVARELPRQRTPQPSAETRVRQVERVADELRAQIRAIALQVQALSEATANQAVQDRAIQELRQAMRQVVVATHQQPKTAQPTPPSEPPLPPIQVNLVLAQAAHLLHQADKDMAVLGNWATLFSGMCIGTLLSVVFTIAGPYTTQFWIYLAVAVFAFLVSMVFVLLTFQARRRVANARRAMDESLVTRTARIGPS